MVETKDFFDRTDLHQLVSFLLYGVENNDNKCNAYESRISATSTELLKKIQPKILTKAYMKK